MHIIYIFGGPFKGKTFWNLTGVRSRMNTAIGIPDRALTSDKIAARTGIDDKMIEALVRAFYERVRRDPLIGPVFDANVHDWETHMSRLCAFWSSVALMSGRYHGQPLAAHLPLPIDSPHFARWLELFAATAQEVCSPLAAAHLLERASRIADSLELGVAAQRGEIRSKSARSTKAPLPLDAEKER